MGGPGGQALTMLVSPTDVYFCATSSAAPGRSGAALGAAALSGGPGHDTVPAPRQVQWSQPGKRRLRSGSTAWPAGTTRSLTLSTPRWRLVLRAAAGIPGRCAGPSNAPGSRTCPRNHRRPTVLSGRGVRGEGCWCMLGSHHFPAYAWVIRFLGVRTISPHTRGSGPAGFPTGPFSCPAPRRVRGSRLPDRSGGGVVVPAGMGARLIGHRVVAGARAGQTTGRRQPSVVGPVVALGGGQATVVAVPHASGRAWRVAGVLRAGAGWSAVISCIVAAHMVWASAAVRAAW